jgi:hypothetical protein
MALMDRTRVVDSAWAASPADAQEPGHRKSDQFSMGGRHHMSPLREGDTGRTITLDSGRNRRGPSGGADGVVNTPNDKRRAGGGLQCLLDAVESRRVHGLVHRDQAGARVLPGQSGNLPGILMPCGSQPPTGQRRPRARARARGRSDQHKRGDASARKGGHLGCDLAACGVSDEHPTLVWPGCRGDEPLGQRAFKPSPGTRRTSGLPAAACTSPSSPATHTSLG